MRSHRLGGARSLGSRAHRFVAGFPSQIHDPASFLLERSKDMRYHDLQFFTFQGRKPITLQSIATEPMRAFACVSSQKANA